VIYCRARIVNYEYFVKQSPSWKFIILSSVYTRATCCPATCCHQHVSCIGNKIVARLLLDTKGYKSTVTTILLPIYKQHVDGNRIHVAEQHVALV